MDIVLPIVIELWRHYFGFFWIGNQLQNSSVIAPHHYTATEDQIQIKSLIVVAREQTYNKKSVSRNTHSLAFNKDKQVDEPRGESWRQGETKLKWNRKVILC